MISIRIAIRRRRIAKNQTRKSLPKKDMKHTAPQCHITENQIQAS